MGQRLDERGMLELLQGGLSRGSLHDYRVGHILDALLTANLNTVLSALVLQALEVTVRAAQGRARRAALA